MSTNVVLNGVTYAVPAEGDSGWGTVLSNFFIAIGAGVLQKSGGSFALTAETDFGASFGLKASYIKSQSANSASAGIVRLGNAESIKWRNAANSGDLDLTVNASNVLQFNGVSFLTAGLGLIVNADINAAAAIAYTKLNLTGSIVNADVNAAAAISYSKLNLSASIVNADVSASAAIAYSKLALASSIVNADISGSAAIAYSKLNLATSILNADISASAAIALSKLSALTVSRALQSNASTGAIEVSAVTNTELGYLSGVTGAIQTQLGNKTDKTTLTTIGDMYYAATANSPARLPIGGAGQVLKSVGGVPTWATFSGGVNYISSNPDAEADTAGWATYADAAGALPVDGTGGTPATSFVRTAVTPLRGSGSFYWGKSANNRQGEGFGFAFTIDSADQAKVLQIGFDYKVDSGTYASGDLAVYIYDVTNAQVIQPTGFAIQGAIGAMKHLATFQTNSNSTSYRLIVHTASVSASAYAMYFDGFSVGPQIVTNGAAITDPVAYTPIFTGFGTPTNVNVKSWRSGTYLHVEGTFTTGTATAVEGQIGLGFNGVAGNVTTDAGLPTISIVGFMGLDSPLAGSLTVLAEASKTYLTYGIMSGTANSNAKVTGSSVGTGRLLSFFAKVPITGWSSNLQLSSETDTKVIAFAGSGATSSAVGSNTIIKFSSLDSDKTGGWNATNGDWTASVPGFYKVTAAIRITGSPSLGQYMDAIIQIDAVTKREFLKYVEYASAGGYSAVVTWEGDLIAGQKIRLLADTNITSPVLTTGTTHTYMQISRVSGPSVIAASEPVLARYKQPSLAQSITNSGYVIVNFDTKDFDSHGSVTTGAAWKFTAPTQGKYRVSHNILFQNSTYAIGDAIDPHIYLNGVDYAEVGFWKAQAASTSLYGAGGGTTVQMLAGDYADLRVSNSRTAGATLLIANAAYNWITVEKVD